MKRLLLIAAFILLLNTNHILAQDGPTQTGNNDAPQETAVGPTYEQQVLEIVNQQRWQNGQLPPLKGNLLLDNAAETHSSNMAVRNFFAHCDLDTKSSPWDRMIAAGYNYNSAAENIAAGYGSPASVMAGWMNSSGHRANILSTSNREIGIGFTYQSGDQANIRYDAGGCTADSGGHGPFGNYWTQNFGRQNSVYPVVINREAFETDTRDVSLYMYGEGWAAEMRFRNEGGTWSAWQPYQPNVAWKLSSGNGLKTVQAEVRSGGTVRSASDNIQLNGSGPSLAITPGTLVFVLQTTGATSAVQPLTIRNNGQEAMAWTLSETPAVPWLTPAATSGNTAAESSSPVNITVSRSGLAEGAYTTSLRVDAGDADFSPQSIPVTFLVADEQVFLPMITR